MSNSFLCGYTKRHKKTRSDIHTGDYKVNGCSLTEKKYFFGLSDYSFKQENIQNCQDEANHKRT